VPWALLVLLVVVAALIVGGVILARRRRRVRKTREDARVEEAVQHALRERQGHDALVP
jgi:type II secretory pathway pseudopilin PulG